MSIVSVVKGILFCAALISACLSLSPWLIFIQYILIFPFNLKLFKWWIDLILNGWFGFACFLLQYLYGTKIVVTGDNAVPGDNVFAISNHRCRLDWMFLWVFFLKEGRLQNMKIAMKDLLKKAIPFNWPMQTHNFLFLSRKWEEDRVYLHKIFNFFRSLKYPIQIVFFPEGTDKTPNTTQRSDKFAKDNNLAPLSHLLHPRTTGFVYSTQKLIDFDLINCIYDITIAYPDKVPQNESSIFTGFPKEVHINLKRFPLDKIPTDDAKLGEWLTDRWYTKDKLLEEFKNNNSFKQEGPKHTPLMSPTYENIYLRSIAIFWIIAPMVSWYYFWHSYTLKLFYFVTWFAFQAITVYCGLDHFEMDYWKNYATESYFKIK
eukprot:TRINITY_DN1838_c0_g1_i4.p1 TRINITY_DN1838_c0_g1~~TRINITY_DN1838_c0_g1_i4.p1  ORF type:complete len:374 (-),score=59.72 TRINITY_DN1838_c0_g1_i4:11-1132(-)